MSDVPNFLNFRNRAEYEQWIIKNAYEFILMRFEGSGNWSRVEGLKTLEDARAEARRRDDPNKRGWMIYAVALVSGAPHSVHVENI